MKTVMGLIIPKEGNIVFDGKNIIGLKPHEIARLGIGLVPEDRRIFPSLTVVENLNLPVIRKRGEGWNLKKIYEYFPRLEERQGHKGFELSGGEQQMLAIARILRTKASLILLDEPTEGLAPLLSKSIRVDFTGGQKGWNHYALSRAEHTVCGEGGRNALHHLQRRDCLYGKP